jgi:CelD/BcsL family acetyltransferase involved in cellulose biosynthesis
MTGIGASFPSAASIEWHAGLPPAVDEELCRLYSNIHSSLAHLRIYGGLDSITHTYIARRGAQASAIFLLRRDGRTLRVVNEGMALDQQTVEHFARYIFGSFPDVDRIEFHAVEARLQDLSYPMQRAVCTAEMPLQLPDSVDDYLTGLGKNMRRNLRRYMEKLQQRFPSFRFDVHEREAIADQDVRAIMDLNRARIAGKRQAYSIDAEEERIIALARACGMVGIGRIDNRICCGAVGYRVGDRYFFKIIGHDPQYNPWSLGILCCYLTICACIERGCREYNFMWNEYEYKFALGACRRDLERLVVYRSRLRLMANAGAACRIALDAWRHRAAALMEQRGRLDQLPAASRAAFHLLHGLRSLKRSVATLRS